MTTKQLALYPGNGDKVGYWLTPPELYSELNEKFHFNYDPAPYPRPAGFDGLTEEWGTVSYLNPPFGQGNKWANKAIVESTKGKQVVMVYPVKRDILNLVRAGAKFQPLEDVHWLDPQGRRTKSPWPTILVLLGFKGKQP